MNSVSDSSHLLYGNGTDFYALTLFHAILLNLLINSLLENLWGFLNITSCHL